MSKSKGNVVDPVEMYATHGADALRLYHLFLGPPTEDANWNEGGIDGTRRFLERVWKLAAQPVEFTDRAPEDRDRDLEGLTHRTVKKVTEDIERFHFNTAIPALMILSNALADYLADEPRADTFDTALQVLLLMLAPMAPHLAHEIWEMRGYEGMLAAQHWPAWDEDLAREETVMLIVQINGKVRDRIEVGADITPEEAERLALASEKARAFINGNQVQKVIAKPPHLVNVVVG
jgi:leucyl-tRNA synthetase